MAGVKNKERRRVWIDSQTEEEILRGIREAKDPVSYTHLHLYGSSIRPFTIQREGSGYHDTDVSSGQYSSATVSYTHLTCFFVSLYSTVYLIYSGKAIPKCS